MEPTAFIDSLLQLLPLERMATFFPDMLLLLEVDEAHVASAAELRRLFRQKQQQSRHFHREQRSEIAGVTQTDPPTTSRLENAGEPAAPAGWKEDESAFPGLRASSGGDAGGGSLRPVLAGPPGGGNSVHAGSGRAVLPWGASPSTAPGSLGSLGSDAEYPSLSHGDGGGVSAPASWGQAPHEDPVETLKRKGRRNKRGGVVIRIA